MSASSAIPAILGGPMVRPSGPPAWPNADSEILAALQSCAQSGDWGRYHGPAGLALQQRLKEMFEVPHALLCSSGTAAMELALRGLNIGVGDEVILAAYDFKGNFLNVATVGATPVLVDVTPDSGQLDPQEVVEAITPRTRAVIASHLHGGVVDLERLRPLVESRGIAVIEDACQMPAAQIGRQRAGANGDVGAISFGGSKLLSAGRGGAILTRREDIAARIRRYGFRGNDAYPLSELQAAVLLPQLARLDERRRIRADSVAALTAQLAQFPFLVPFNQAERLVEPDYYKVGLRYDARRLSNLPRDSFAAALRAEGVAIAPGFRALHQIHARGRFRQIGNLTEATRADAEWLVLHHPVLLEGPIGIQEIVTAIEKIAAHADTLRDAQVRTDRATSPWEFAE